jgi:hypothetical protein
MVFSIRMWQASRQAGDVTSRGPTGERRPRTTIARVRCQRRTWAKGNYFAQSFARVFAMQARAQARCGYVLHTDQLH